MTAIDHARRRLLAGTGAWLAAAPLAARTRAADGCTTLAWHALAPAGWQAWHGPDGRVGRDDCDAGALARMARLRKTWDDAPTVAELDGAGIRLHGFLIPLPRGAADGAAFLLVPHYGACIHAPPPPANQVVRVVPTRPVAGFRRMDTAWVSGTLHVARQHAPIGASAYRLDNARLDRYGRSRFEGQPA